MDDSVEKLKELKSLLDDGVLTQDEFNDQKAKILGSTDKESQQGRAQRTSNNQQIEQPLSKNNGGKQIPKKSHRGLIISLVVIIAVILAGGAGVAGYLLTHNIDEERSHSVHQRNTQSQAEKGADQPADNNTNYPHAVSWSGEWEHTFTNAHGDRFTINHDDGEIDIDWNGADTQDDVDFENGSINNGATKQINVYPLNPNEGNKDGLKDVSVNTVINIGQSENHAVRTVLEDFTKMYLYYGSDKSLRLAVPIIGDDNKYVEYRLTDSD